MEDWKKHINTRQIRETARASGKHAIRKGGQKKNRELEDPGYARGKMKRTRPRKKENIAGIRGRKISPHGVANHE